MFATDVREGVPIFRQWTGPVRLATYVAIQRLANRRRQKLVQEITRNFIAEDSHLKGWALMSGHFSFMPAYWCVLDILAARAMLRVRLDVACNEGAQRRVP